MKTLDEYMADDEHDVAVTFAEPGASEVVVHGQVGDVLLFGCSPLWAAVVRPR